MNLSEGRVNEIGLLLSCQKKKKFLIDSVGASPAKNGKYINQIGSPALRSANQWLRQQKAPFPGWRAADSGHFHLRR